MQQLKKIISHEKELIVCLLFTAQLRREKAYSVDLSGSGRINS
jgi:hypothetical protein